MAHNKLNITDMETIISKQWTLKLRDFLLGAIVAVLSATIPMVVEVLKAGSFDINWALVGTVAGSTFLGYLLKNLGEPTKVVTVKTGDEIKGLK